MWDWNGTLFDDLPAVVSAVNVSLARLGVDPIDEAEYRRHYRRPVHLFYESILGRSVGPAEMAEVDRVFHDAYKPLADRIDLGEDASRAVEAVSEAGLTQSVLSMWWHEDLAPAVTRLGLAPRMVAVDGHRGEAGEPKADHLTRHVDRMCSIVPGLGRSEIVMIGDITDDASAAAACGIGCVLYDGGSQPVEALRATGRPVASSLVEAVALAGVPVAGH